jgi:hypothetical protein
MNDRYKLNLFIQKFDYFLPLEITDEIYSVENLRIALIYEKHSKKKKEQLLGEWMTLLPKLKNIKRVTLVYPLNQEFFEYVCQMPNLEFITLSSLKIEDVSPIANLKNLNRLYIDSCHRMTTISSLASLKNLEYLSIENCHNIKDLELIGQLTNLKALSLNGDAFAPKNLLINSLKPFRNLKKLKHLDLGGASIKDKTYDIVLEMPELERFDISGSLNPSVVDEIKAKHKNLKAGFFMDWDYRNKKIFDDKDWFTDF